MKTTTKSLLAAVVGALAMSAAATASAHDHDYDRSPQYEHGRQHYKHHDDRDRKEVHERVIVRRVVPVAYVQPATYYAPATAYYRSDPAIVIGISLPPIVIPLR